MAGPPARSCPSAGALRRDPGKDPRRGAGPRQGAPYRTRVRADGGKEVLGLWVEQNEERQILAQGHERTQEPRYRGYMLAVVDGLKGFPDAITAVFPDAIVQTCIVHLLRNSMDFVSWKDRKPLVAALKGIYRAVDAQAAPVPCWWTRTIVPSIMAYSKSGSPDNSFEQNIKDPLHGPAAETPEVRVPVAEVRWQISPCGTRARDPQNRFSKQTVVHPETATVPRFTGNKRFNLLPLLVAQCMSVQMALPSPVLNPISPEKGIP